MAARSTADGDGVKAMTNWDIHDDSLLTEGHTISRLPYTNTAVECPPDPKVEEIHTDFDAVETAAQRWSFWAPS